MLGSSCSPCCGGGTTTDSCAGLYEGTRAFSVTVGVTNITPTGLSSPSKIDSSRPWLDLSSFLIGTTSTPSVTMPMHLYWSQPGRTPGPRAFILRNTWDSQVVLTYETANGFPVSQVLSRPDQYPYTSDKWCHVYYGIGGGVGGGIAARQIGTTLGATISSAEAMMVVADGASEATFTGTIAGRVNIAGLSSSRPYVPGGYTTIAGGLSFVATVPFSWDGFSTTLTGHTCAQFLDSGYGWTADIQLTGVAS